MNRVLPWLRGRVDLPLVRDTALLSSGSAAAQLVMLAAMPVWARLYSPEDFGVLGLWTAVVGVVSVLVVLRLDTCIVIASDAPQARALAQLGLWLAAGGATLLAAAAWAAPEALRARFGLAGLGHWLPIAVLGGGLAAAIAVLQYAANRRRAFARMAASRLVLAGVAAAVGIAFGWAGVASGLLVAQLAGALAALATLALAVAPADRATSPRAGRAELAAAARAHADAPRYLWPAALLDTLTQQLPLVLIAAWYSQALAGQFSLAWRMLAVPLFMLSAAAASVFYQRMAALADRPREARALLLGSWRLFAGVGALPALAVMLWGEPLFAFVFGAEWAAAGRIAAVLMPMLWAMFVSAPTSSALIVLGLQKWSIVFGLGMLVVRPLAFWIGARQDRLATGLWAWVGGELLLIAAYNLLILRRLREPG